MAPKSTMILPKQLPQTQGYGAETLMAPKSTMILPKQLPQTQGYGAEIAADLPLPQPATPYGSAQFHTQHKVAHVLPKHFSQPAQPSSGY